MKYSAAVAAIVLASTMESVTAGPVIGILGRGAVSLLGGALTSGGSSSKSSRSIGSEVISGGEDVLKDLLKSFGSGAATEGGKVAVSAVASKVGSKRSEPTMSPADVEVLRRSLGSLVVDGGEDIFKTLLKSFGSGAASQGGSEAVSAIASKAGARRSMPTGAPVSDDEIVAAVKRSLGSLVVDGGEDIFKTLLKSFGSGAASQGGSEAVSAVASKAGARRAEPTGLTNADVEVLRRSIGSLVVDGGEDIFKTLLKSFGSGAASQGGSEAVSAIASKAGGKRDAPTATAAAPAATATGANKWEDGMVQCIHEYAADNSFTMTSNGNDTVTLNNVGPQCMGVATSYLADPASQHLDPMFGSLKILAQNTVQLYNIPPAYLQQIEANIAAEEKVKAAAAQH